MEHLFNMVEEEQRAREEANPVVSAPKLNLPPTPRPSRAFELSVLLTLFFIALFCTTGTYYWKVHKCFSNVLWQGIACCQSRPVAQSNARFQEYQRWVPIRKGDHVIPVGETAADVLEVHGVPRDAVVMGEGHAKRFIVLGPNSYLVRTNSGRNQILRRDEIGVVITAQTASR